GPGARCFPAAGWSALAGVALGVDFLLFNYGLRLTTAANAGLLVNFGQVSNIVLARAVLGEAVTARRLAGAALTVAGIGIVNAGADDSRPTGRLPGNLPLPRASISS